MNEWWRLALAFLEGVVLGVIFFGGLWWTVRQGVSSKRVALWFLLSMVLRTCIVLLGFYYILGGNWQRLLVGLLGFVVARMIVVRFTRETEPASKSAQGAGHAP
jgi:F1F0 ATPase subunit 2